jgi:hypothetical protein
LCPLGETKRKRIKTLRYEYIFREWGIDVEWFCVVRDRDSWRVAAVAEINLHVP